MRTFTYRDARSHKFWNIEVSGKSHTVTYGRVGSKGRTQTKKFASAAEAETAAEKLIRAKLAKGYRETTAGVADGASPAAELPPLATALEAAIRENPEELANYAAYADWLTEQGDPRGEFMQVQIALENEGLSKSEREKLRRREEALLKKHESEWVGEWAELAKDTGPEGRGQLPMPGPKYRFERGCLVEVNLDSMNLACARAFVAAPQTRFVRILRIGDCYDERGTYEPGDDIPDDGFSHPGLHVLPRWPYFEHLRVFQLGFTSDEGYGDFCNFQCHLYAPDVDQLVARMPHLEELYLFVQGIKGEEIARLSLPRLRVYQLYHAHDYSLAQLAANRSLTNLTHLLCHPHAIEGRGAHITLHDLWEVVDSKYLASLRHLRLRLTDAGDTGCRAIVESRILKRLETLDLRHGCITDEGARILARCRDLKRIQLLDVSRNELTEEGIALLTATGVNVRTEHQHGPTEPGTEYPEYLMEGDYE
jgi:uncharacterized protein (TIGR02996 family)